MKLFKKESAFFKVLHSCLLNAMICQVLLPAEQAYASAEINHSIRTTPAQPVFYRASEVVTNIPAAVNRSEKRAVEERVARGIVSMKPGGPGQQESGNFSLNTTSTMVDPFTGDFSYSIPLMDVEGYPIVINYNSNTGMMDEASWVGLGWNLNVGSVSREMRGLPDDFNGTDKVERTFSVKENDISSGYKMGATIGLFYQGSTLPNKSKVVTGGDLSALIGGYQSAYVGKGHTFDFNIGAQYSLGEQYNFKLGGGLGYSRDSKNGIGRSSTVGASFGYEKDLIAGLGYNWGSNYSSRFGVQQRNLGASMTLGAKKDDFKASARFGYGTTFTVGGITMPPRVQLHSISKAANASAQFGVSALFRGSDHWGYNIGLEVLGYSVNENFTYTDDDNKKIIHPAYGYFHSYAGDHNTDGIPLLDFNRERDAEFSDQMINLPFSNPTYDVFYVNGLGIQATFRGHRREIGAYSDDVTEKESKGNGGAVSGALVYDDGDPTNIMLGGTYNHSSGGMESGQWYQPNDPIAFRSDAAVFFKGIGEPTPTDDKLLNLVGGEAVAWFDLSKTETSTDVSVHRSNTLNIAAGMSVALTNTNIAAAVARDVRANVYTPVLAGEFPSTDPNTFDYPYNDFTAPLASATALVRTNGQRLANHVSAIQVKAADGMNYTYGIPVYSYKQEDVSFSSCNSSADGQGLATYTTAQNSIFNACGKANLFDRNLIPAYSGAFLLTAVTSSDYSDVSGNGFTSDDIGNYYKINHTRVWGDSPGDAYKWRFPVCGGTVSNSEAPKALFNEGLLSIDSDNMASYAYGEKEIWYTHSVESKNMIAEFVLEDRYDAYGVQGEDGVLDLNKPLKRLARIELYNRNERLSNPNAKPVQVVEFIYDYSLCKGNPSNVNSYPSSSTPPANSGKLTLKEIRFYSGERSEELALMPYKFTYSAVNPNFSYLASDRWGKYQPNADPTHPLELFPYANQHPTDADAYAEAWKIVKIDMPSGSSVEMDYESDTYAYVQDKPAMDLVKIKGYSDLNTVGPALATNTWNPSDATNEIYTPANAREVVIVELNEPILASTMADAATRFRDDYLKDPSKPQYMKEVYLRNFVDVKGDGVYELIPTFATIADHGFYQTGGGVQQFPATGVLPASTPGSYQYGYIVLQEVPSSDKEKHPDNMNPVLKTAMEFARLHLPEIVYGSCEDCDPNLHIDRYAFWRGDVYKGMAAYGYCNTVDLSRSEIRLYDHDDKRFGGNARVKQITLRDNWNNMSGGEENGVYHWNYLYEQPKIAYGVAAYEPMTGNDENPFYHWSRYTNKSVSFPDESRFSVEPIGEMLFPSPTIGYNYVEVRMSHESGNNVNLGYAVNEYFTAKEKPTISKTNTIEKVKADRTDYFSSEIDLFGFTQGHTVITNDFHGRPKQSRIYSGSTSGQTTLISRSTYIYRELGEDVPMLDEKGAMANYQTGMEYDIHSDARFVKTTSNLILIGLSIKFKLPTFVPNGFMPIVSSKLTEQGFYTTCFNKHIHYSAVVKEIQTETTGSVNNAQNLVYDKASGNVLVSSLTDEFNEPLYSVAYPAHWYYTLLRNPLEQPAAAVAGTIASGTFTPASGLILQDKFSAGDIVDCTIGSTTTQLYVLSIDPGTTTSTPEKMRLIKVSDASAFTTAGSATLTLKKSGRKNILGPMVQQVVTKRNPINGTAFNFPTSDVIDASALTLKPRTNVKCAGPGQEGIQPNSVINPYKYGILNNLMTEYEYGVQVERSSTQLQGIRYNGTLQNYFPFYAYNLTRGAWYKLDQPSHPNYISAGDLRKWRKSGQVNTVDEFGKVTTVLDPIAVPSAALYGYNRMIPVAQAVNAEQHQIAFDAFEEYDYLAGESTPSDTGHFDFRKILGSSFLVVETEKHSGLKSLQVLGGKAGTVKRSITPIEESCQTTGSFSSSEQNFTATDCRCIKLFEPTPGRYIISLWVKGTNVDAITQNYSGVSVTVSFSLAGSTNYTLFPTGQKLDGWQRIEGEFIVPASGTISVTLTNTTGSYAYFDDLRMHPFLASMSTTVYDPVTLLPMASHDGYNFTTFYNYDENLNQVRMRVETIDGIRTVVETEAGTAVKTPKY